MAACYPFSPNQTTSSIDSEAKSKLIREENTPQSTSRKVDMLSAQLKHVSSGNEMRAARRNPIASRKCHFHEAQ